MTDWPALVGGLAREIREGAALAAKRDIAGTVASLGLSASDPIRVGDDCAAIPDGDGFLLLAIEGFLDGFTATMPWFAGWCGVMVNLSDIAAMGGRPLAVVDALWSDGADDARPVLDGLRDAARVYGVPIVGGHTSARAARRQLAVAVLGRADRLLTSFDARAGDVLVAAIDLRGAFHDPHPFWDAATRGAPAERLRGDLAILPGLAADGLCRAAKDISMGGLPGTALMLAECSGVGVVLDLDRVPCPPGVEPVRWLAAFPSYGFLLAVAQSDVPAVLARFGARGIAAAAVGACEVGTRVDVRHGGDRRETCWDFARETLLGCGAAA